MTFTNAMGQEINENYPHMPHLYPRWGRCGIPLIGALLVRVTPLGGVTLTYFSYSQMYNSSILSIFIAFKMMLAIKKGFGKFFYLKRLRVAYKKACIYNLSVVSKLE